MDKKLGLSNRIDSCTVPDKLVEQADFVLSIGGDLYTFAEKEHNWPFPYRIVDAGNQIMQAEKRYVIWCASIGPLEKAGSRLGEIKDHLHRCHSIIVREPDSYSYLRDTLGIRDNVHLAADPAFLMDPVPFEDTFITRTDTPLVAMNFSQGPFEHIYGHGRVDEIQSRISRQVVALLGALPVRIMFVPHVFRDNQFLQPIFDRVSASVGKDRISLLPSGLGSPKTKWAVSQANALVAMRFHCAMAGFGTATPTAVLVSTTKGRRICRDMYGNSDWAIEIGDVTHSLLIDKVDALLRNETGIRSLLGTASSLMKERAMLASRFIGNRRND